MASGRQLERRSSPSLYVFINSDVIPSILRKPQLCWKQLPLLAFVSKKKQTYLEFAHWPSEDPVGFVYNLSLDSSKGRISEPLQNYSDFFTQFQELFVACKYPKGSGIFQTELSYLVLWTFCVW